MKTYSLLLLFFFSIIGLAAGYGGASGTNSLGEIIHIEGDIADTIYVQKNEKDHEWTESYDFLEECPDFPQYAKEGEELKDRFSCRKEGKSPLAGAVYKMTTSEDWRPCESFPEDMGFQPDPNIDYGFDAPGDVYVCIAGCDNPRAPKIFYVNPWECG
jgi:hypothetical protein